MIVGVRERIIDRELSIDNGSVIRVEVASGVFASGLHSISGMYNKTYARGDSCPPETPSPPPEEAEGALYVGI